MHFLSPWMLWGLGALAVPVIIHLWHRRRARQIRFSTLRLLKQVAIRTRHRARVENLFLLLLRSAVFALIIMAVAKPVASRNGAGLLGGEVPRVVVLAIDNSASMGCRNGLETRLEASKRNALAVIDSLRPADSVAVVAANRTAQRVIAEPTVDHNAAREAVKQIEPTMTRGDFSQPFLEARAIFSKASSGDREIYLFTDDQEANWRFDTGPVFDEAWRGLSVRTVVVRPDETQPPNAAVRKVQVVTPFAGPGELVQGVATIANFGVSPLNDLLQVTLEGERVLQKPLEVAPGATLDVPFEFQVPSVAPGSARGIASIEGDSFSADDKFQFLVPIQQTPSVLIVEGARSANARISPAFYLGKALQAGGATPPVSIGIESLAETPLQAHTALFLVDIADPGDRALLRIEQFLQDGGTIVVFPGEQGDLQWQEKAGLSPATRRGLVGLPPGRIATEIKEPGHPLFANLWGTGTPFPALPQRKAIDLEPADNARVLVTMAGRIPFLIQASHKAGQIFLVNASADRSWGDLPLSPAFVPLIQQLARLSSEHAAAGNSILAGETVPLPPAPAGSPERTIEMPNGNTHKLGGESPVANAPGFYIIRDAAGGASAVAVNVDRTESDFRQADPGMSERIAGAETITGIDNLRTWLSRSRGQVPVWPSLLVLALLFFGAEAVLSNFMARTRAQGVAEQIPTGRLNKRRLGVVFHPAKSEVSS